MGGQHATYEIDGETTFAHGGGHNNYNRVAVGTYFVAELVPRQQPSERNPGWCLDDLPPYAFDVTQLVVAKDRDDARRLLKKPGGS